MALDVISTLNYTCAIVGTSDLLNTRAVSVDRDDVISYGDVTENTDRLFVVPAIARPCLKHALTTAAHQRSLSPHAHILVTT
jgi:hypothetical protein